jgi:hypothetical protein
LILPYAALLASTSAPTFVNARNYVVTEGHYALGLHVFRNLVDYVVALHVGQHTTAVRIAVVAASALLLAVGSGRVRLYTLWIWFTLVPASLFTWPNVARYEYLPAIGLALLVTEESCLPMACSGVARDAWRRAAAVLMTVVVVRSASFGTRGPDLPAHGRAPSHVRQVQREHPARPSGRTVNAIPIPACRQRSMPPSGLSTTTPESHLCSRRPDAET